MSRFLLIVGVCLGLALAASAGGYLYLLWGRPRDLIAIEVQGEVSARAARTTQWRPVTGVAWLGDKDSLLVTAKGRAKATGQGELKPGIYQVNRNADGVLEMAVASTERFDWTPKPIARGIAELRAAEAELAALRSLLEKRKPLRLESTHELIPMKRVDFEFEDFELKLLEPPVGRRFSPEGDIHLHWTPVPFDELTYHVDLARSARFKGAVPRVSRTNRLSIHLSEPGLYYWRVTALQRGRRLRSVTSTFLVK